MPAEASVAVRTLFAPYDATTDEYLAFVSSAKRSIYILIYGMHLPALTETLIAKHRAGVKVNLILDHSQAAGRAESAEVQKLVDAGVPLLIGTSPVHHQILHTKATIIDECAVESGSWNYSLSASAQSNTLTFVHDVEYARAYLQHWHTIRGFVALHDMIYQPKGEAPAEDVPANDLTSDETTPPRLVDAVPPSAPAGSHSSSLAGDAPPPRPPARRRAPVRKAAAALAGVPAHG